MSIWRDASALRLWSMISIFFYIRYKENDFVQMVVLERLYLFICSSDIN